MPLRRDIRPELEFRSVWFSYDEDRAVLRNMSFRIEPEETVALVGLNGSGKSTIGLLATGLYTPDAGSILVGGSDTQEVGGRSLRATISLVPQDPILFDETIRGNLLYGNPRATSSDLDEVAALTQLDRVLQRLPKGYDEPLGPLGAKLSGGEKKRLALARTLLQQPRILIVDEITSSLDQPSATALLHGLEHFRRARTLVVVSHRPSTILWADRILVVEDGAIVDSGKHGDLIGRCHAYRRIWQSQDCEAAIDFRSRWTSPVRARDRRPSMLGATFTFTNSRAEKKMLDHDLSLTHSGSESAPALHEVCRSVLNPASLSFVAANAPWDVVNSFEVRQQRLASLSLQVAGALLKRQLRATDTNSFDRPLLPLFRSHVSRMKSVMLLAACTFGRLGLGVLGTLWHGTPRHFQIDLSATILRNVGDLLTDSDTSVETRSESVPDADALRLDALKKVYAEEARDSDVAADILRALAVSLPNELSRLIFLATLRDNNSGHYFHPDLARRFSERIADRGNARLSSTHLQASGCSFDRRSDRSA